MAKTDSELDALPSQWLALSAERHGPRPALISDSAEITYGALLDRTARLAGSMAGQGLGPGTPFAVISEKAERVARAIHLSLYGGSAVWPLDPRRPDLLPGLMDAGIQLALLDEGLSMPEGIGTLPSQRLVAPANGAAVEPASIAPTGIQLIVSTSGSTGQPRGVMLTPANLAAAVRASRGRIALQTGDVWLACLPLYHVAGISILLRCLEAGATVLLHDRFEVDRLWASLERHAVTHLSLVPPMLEGLLGPRDSGPPASLKVVLLGGGAIPASLVRRAVDAGWPVCPTYGLSENASQVATLCRAPRQWRPGDMGPPLKGMRVEIVDPAGRPAPGPGRIRISGPSVMAGYVNASWLSGEGIEEGGFTTSDLGYLDERGHLHVLGRVDDVIVSGGENVVPAQVEGILAGCEGVADIGVVGVPDERWGERVVAVFAGTIGAPELERWCRDRVAAPLRPRGFIKIDALPRNPMGKLDRRTLRRHAQEALND